MIEMHFGSMSASEAGDYVQVLFEGNEDDLAGDYFLIQCQFEFPSDDAGWYFESKVTRLCGHFTVHTATLNRRWLHLEMPSTEWKGIRIHFAVDDAAYRELSRTLSAMFEERLLHADQDA